MKLTTTNKQAIKFYLIVLNVKARGRKTRALSKFKNLLIKPIQEYEENQKGCEEEELEELHNDPVVIDLTEFEPYFEYLISALDEWDMEINGEDADVYDGLMEELEKIQKESEENGN